MCTDSTFHACIKQARLSKGLTFEELSSGIDIPVPLLIKIENNKIIPNKYQLYKLANYLGITANDLLMLYQQQRLQPSTHQSTLNLLNHQPLATQRKQNIQSDLAMLADKKLNVIYHKPSSPAGAFIETIVYCENHQLNYSMEHVLPDGITQAIFILGGEGRYIQSGKKEILLQRAMVAGTQNRQLSYRLLPAKATVYVRFKPWGLYHFTNLPQDKLNDQVVEADQIFGPAIWELHEKMEACSSPYKILELLEAFFNNRISEKELHPLVQHVLSKQDMPLPDIVKSSGYTSKHVSNTFKKYVGIPPKFYQRLNRFNTTLNRLHAGGIENDWTSLVYANGYYDQAHFVKEFKLFTSFTPQSFLALGTSCTNYIHTY